MKRYSSIMDRYYGSAKIVRIQPFSPFPLFTQNVYDGDACMKLVWLNDNLIPLDQARVPVNDRGFLYGDGLFETLRTETGAGSPSDRAPGAPGRLGPGLSPAFPGQDPLAGTPGAIADGQRFEPGSGPGENSPDPGGWPQDWACRKSAIPPWSSTPRPYTPPSPEAYAAGWPVVVFPEGRSTFVGRHKSLNYLFYLAARQFALDQGAKEALILEADGLVSEGAATSLIYLHQGHYYLPASASALPGVTVTVLGRGLAARGLSLKARRTTVAQLKACDGLWLANSLMGLMPVAAVNGAPVPVSASTAFLQEVLADMS